MARCWVLAHVDERQRISAHFLRCAPDMMPLDGRSYVRERGKMNAGESVLVKWEDTAAYFGMCVPIALVYSAIPEFRTPFQAHLSRRREAVDRLINRAEATWRKAPKADQENHPVSPPRRRAPSMLSTLDDPGHHRDTLQTMDEASVEGWLSGEWISWIDRFLSFAFLGPVSS